MGSDPQYIKYPDLRFAQDVFNLSNASAPQTVRQASLKKLQNAIKEYRMAPFYRHLAHPVEGVLNNSGEGGPQHPHGPGVGGPVKTLLNSNMLASRKTSQSIDFPWDEALYQSLVEDNKKDLETFQKEEDDAEEAAGETEVSAARGKRAEFWARVGDKVCFFIAPGKRGGWTDLNRTKRSNPTRLCSKRPTFLARRSIWCWPCSGSGSFLETRCP